MAVAYSIYDKPSDYGLMDWYHDEDGRVNYSWEQRTPTPYEERINFATLEKEDTSYDEGCTEEALDNLAWGRDHYVARCEAWDEWERNERMFN